MRVAEGAAGVRGRRLLARQRLLELMLGTQTAVIEAGAGFGKTILAEQLRDSMGIGTVVVRLAPRDRDPDLLCATLRRSLRTSRLSDLASAVEGRDALDDALDALLDALSEAEDPVLLVLDDVHHAAGGVAGAILDRLRLELRSPHRLAILGRSLSQSAGARRGAGELWLGASELAFDRAEVAEILRSWLGGAVPGHAAAVLEGATAGWPAAVSLAAALAAKQPDPLAAIYELAAGPSLMGGLLDALTSSLGEAESSRLVQLAHLPLLSGRVARAATGMPDLLASAVAVGVPLTIGETGWWRLPEPVAEHLRRATPLAPQTAEGAARVYLDAGEELAAVSVLLAAGRPAEAASVLAALPADRLERLGPAEVRALIDSFPATAIEARPRVLLALSRVSELGYRAGHRNRALARCRELAAAAGDDRLLREVTAEDALDRVREGAVDEARQLAQSVLAAAGADELSARARALDCLARLRSLWSYAPDAADETEQLLREAASASVGAGHPSWAAGLLIRLAQDVFYATCRHLDAVAVLDEALELIAQRPRVRALALIFRAEPLRELGRYDEARSAVTEAREIGRIFHDERILGYAAWEEMLAAAQVGERAACLAAVAEVERHRGSWFAGFTGLEFLAEAADALDRIGATEEARAYLARARRRTEATPDPELRCAEALVTARSGDPELGRTLVDRALGEQLPPVLTWRLRLLGAYADLRRGAANAEREAAAAFELCLSLGIAALPLVVEPAVAAALLPPAAAGGSAAAAEMLGAAQRMMIHLLGGFELIRAGRRVPVPPGRQALALKAVAVHGGRLQADQLVELLWPESPPAAGRARLRTVLSRLRSVCGEVLERNGEVVALAPGIEIDAAIFEGMAREAVRMASRDPGRATARARAALLLYGGPLLPDDTYEDWVTAPRERLRSLQLELLDIAIAAAVQAEQLDEAIRLLQEAIAIEPYDEVRYERLARLLIAQGRVGSARTVLSQARGAMRRIGLAVSFDAGAILALSETAG